MSVTVGTSVILGRDPSCDVVIDGAGSQVSRRHARLTARGHGHFVVEDLGSTNGVFVNGQRVQHGAVGPGDTLSLGSYVFAWSLLSMAGQGGAWRSVGRDPSCDHVIPLQADGVSRVHAFWRPTPDGRLELRDAQSANGLWIRGQRVPGGVVGADEVVALGTWRLDLRLLQPTAMAAPALAPVVVPSFRGAPAQPPVGDGDQSHGGAPVDDWTPPPSGNAAFVVVLAAAALLMLGGLVAAQTGLLSRIGLGPLVEPSVPPAEAIAMVSLELQTSSSLGEHLETYTYIAQELEPYRAHLESAQSLVDTYEQVEQYEALGHRPWPLLVQASPHASAVDRFMQCFERVVGAARRIHTALTNVPLRARALLETVAAARAQPSREMVHRLQASLAETATQFRDAATETGPLRQGLQLASQALEAVRSALRSLRETALIGDMLQVLADGVGVVAEPVNASLGLVSSLDDALNADGDALDRLGTKLGALKID